MNKLNQENVLILGSPPNWPIRWGITVIFIIGLVILSGSAMIKYPIVLTSKIVITSSTPPIKVFARTTGRFSALLVVDNQEISRNTLLAILENSAKYEDVVILEEQIESILGGEVTLDDFELHRTSNLGTLQDAYNQVASSLDDYLFNEKYNTTKKDLETLERKIVQNEVYLINLVNQSEILSKKLEIIRHDYERNKKLLLEDVLSVVAFETEEIELLEAINQYEGSNLLKTNTEIYLTDLNGELSRLKIEHQDKKRYSLNRVIESLKNLKSSIVEWKQKYLVVSPVDGRVAYLNNWQEGQLIKDGEEIMAIVNEHRDNAIVGKVETPILNSGKLQIGQKVNVYLDNYPFEEYGILRGTIEKISLVPKINSYLIYLSFDNNLVTSYNKQLIFREELQGRADIITEDLSLFERFFFSLRRVVNR